MSDYLKIPNKFSFVLLETDESKNDRNKSMRHVAQLRNSYWIDYQIIMMWNLICRPWILGIPWTLGKLPTQLQPFFQTQSEHQAEHFHQCGKEYRKSESVSDWNERICKAVPNEGCSVRQQAMAGDQEALKPTEQTLKLNYHSEILFFFACCSNPTCLFR